MQTPSGAPTPIAPGRPALAIRPCPVCGTPVEPLRAQEVVLVTDGFRFLCSYGCRQKFLLGERSESVRRPASASQSGPLPALTDRKSRRRDRHRVRAEPRRRGDKTASNPTSRADNPIWLGLGFSALGALFGGLAAGPVLAWMSALSIFAAVVVAAVQSLPDRPRLGTLGWLSGPVGATLAALSGIAAVGQPGLATRLLLGGAAVASACVLGRVWLAQRTEEPLRRLVEKLRAALPERVELAEAESDWSTSVHHVEVSVEEVRAGQQVLVGEGQLVGVDGLVQAGEALVVPHPSAAATVRCVTGDPVIAGARVVEGEIRVLASRVGRDRALIRPAYFDSPADEGGAWLTRIAQRGVLWGGGAGLVVATLALLLRAGSGEFALGLSAAAAVLLAAPLVSIRRASAANYLVAAAAAADRGITFQNARMLDRAGRSSVAVLCTHGVITESEPEVVETHGVGDGDWKEAVALAAGAEEAAEGHTIAFAIRRFCEKRSIVPTAVRRAQYSPGRGVTALTPEGLDLVVGNRGLLLAEGVSVAVADAQAALAANRGHTVLFIGLDGRLRPRLSLRSDDRLGARAAVQRLIDLGMEIVLLSGDHRETVEAMAQRLDIGHIRAELTPDERGREVSELRQIGALVTVIGRPGTDDRALDAADVPVVLGAAGGPDGERAIALTSEDVRDASAALWLARAARNAAFRRTIVAGIAGGLTIVLSALGQLPPVLAALIALGIDGYVLPGAARLLRRINLRFPNSG